MVMRIFVEPRAYQVSSFYPNEPHLFALTVLYLIVAGRRYWCLVCRYLPTYLGTQTLELTYGP